MKKPSMHLVYLKNTYYKLQKKNKTCLIICLLKKSHFKGTPMPWQFCILNPQNARVNLPMKFVNFLKSRTIFNIFYCFWMFVNKLFTYLRCAYLRKCFNVKSSTRYFNMKTKILADFQICISLPLMNTQNHSYIWIYNRFIDEHILIDLWF